MDNEALKMAADGDINSFQQLFSQFQGQLKSYLYRLLASRNDAEDLTHGIFKNMGVSDCHTSCL
jgi:RNA polymerase sigma-70 factor, ECF subfamily